MEKRKVLVVVSRKGARLPTYSSKEAAGADVYACIEKELTLLPQERKLIPTGLKFSIPVGYEIQVRPRSGLAWKEGITVLNTPGTIDSDYRGEVSILLINLGEKSFVLTPQMRIAQLVLAPVCIAEFTHSDVLEETARGEGGFGHTGVY